jgi:hypothetical protein
MTTQDKIKVIAEYDGMSTFETEHDLFFKRGVGCTPENYDYHLLHLKYLASLDWLHPVAMKVMNGLCVIALSKRGNIETKSKRLFHNIKEQCSTFQINGEYIDLFNAVYDGIVFLNSNK